MSTTVIQMQEGENQKQVEKKAIQVLENTYIRMEFDEDSLIHRLIYKPEETVLAEKVDDLLVIQRKVIFRLKNHSALSCPAVQENTISNCIRKIMYSVR